MKGVSVFALLLVLVFLVNACSAAIRPIRNFDDDQVLYDASRPNFRPSFRRGGVDSFESEEEERAVKAELARVHGGVHMKIKAKKFKFEATQNAASIRVNVEHRLPADLVSELSAENEIELPVGGSEGENVMEAKIEELKVKRRAAVEAKRHRKERRRSSLKTREEAEKRQ